MIKYALLVAMIIGLMIGLMFVTAIGLIAIYSQALLAAAIISMIIVAAISLTMFKQRQDRKECLRQRHQLDDAFKPRIKEIEATGKLEATNIKYLCSRWLQQVLTFEDKAIVNASQYQLLHGIAVVGSAIIPALAGLNFVDNPETRIYVQSITAGLSLVVAIALALEQVSHANDRWRFYRSAVEALKAEGWDYLLLCGDYQGKDHSAKFSDFVAQTEKIIQSEGADYIASVVLGKPQ